MVDILPILFVTVTKREILGLRGISTQIHQNMTGSQSCLSLEHGINIV